MNEATSKIFTGFRYVYLLVFFILLAGFFHPLITDTSFGSVIIGVIILFVGLTGGILLYKSAITQKRREIFLVLGFTLISISLFYIFQIVGRF